MKAGGNSLESRSRNLAELDLRLGLLKINRPSALVVSEAEGRVEPLRGSDFPAFLFLIVGGIQTTTIISRNVGRTFYSQITPGK
jgi:hypothetical protein